ncbi:MAG: Uncharacterised protein [Alphaproteobacteria bacterium]|nr:MAG: Uncharacterised protein [Alphaproteobacteria bacterium]
MHAFIGTKGQVNINQSGFLRLLHGLLEKYHAIASQLIGIARQFINLPALITVNDQLCIGARFGNRSQTGDVSHYTLTSTQLDFQQRISLGLFGLSGHFIGIINDNCESGGNRLEVDRCQLRDCGVFLLGLQIP